MIENPRGSMKCWTPVIGIPRGFRAHVVNAKKNPISEIGTEDEPKSIVLGRGFVNHIPLCGPE